MVEYCGTRAGIPLVFSPPCSILLFPLFFFPPPFSCSSSLPSTGRQSRAEPPFRGRFSPLSTAFPPVVFLSLLTCGTSRNLSIIIVLRASARGLSLCLLSLPFFHSSSRRRPVVSFAPIRWARPRGSLGNIVFGWDKDQQVGLISLFQGFIIINFCFQNCITNIIFLEIISQTSSLSKRIERYPRAI